MPRWGLCFPPPFPPLPHLPLSPLLPPPSPLLPSPSPPSPPPPTLRSSMRMFKSPASAPPSVCRLKAEAEEGVHGGAPGGCWDVPPLTRGVLGARGSTLPLTDST